MKKSHEALPNLELDLKLMSLVRPLPQPEEHEYEELVSEEQDPAPLHP